MRLLIDTHVFLWAVMNSARLAGAVRDCLADPANDLFVSAVSAWEIAIKAAHGRLDYPAADFEADARRIGAEPLDVTAAHGMAAGLLPRHHDDPFDRMLVAQARLEDMTLVTADGRLKDYGIPILAA